jgi:hypothetical protein
VGERITETIRKDSEDEAFWGVLGGLQILLLWAKKQHTAIAIAVLTVVFCSLVSVSYAFIAVCLVIVGFIAWRLLESIQFDDTLDR